MSLQTYVGMFIQTKLYTLTPPGKGSLLETLRSDGP